MGAGYIAGCLASILFWRIDRAEILMKMNNGVEHIISNKRILEIVYIALAILVCIAVGNAEKKQIYDGIVAFLVIDISNIERKSLNKKDKIQFYESISTISTALVCGFVGPLLYIFAFGNGFALAFMLLYNISLIGNFQNVKIIVLILSIVPAFIIEVFLYIIYFIRYKKGKVDFKGDYLLNFFLRPLLNVDILAAYLESVNFYYFYEKDQNEYLKSYGEYNKKVDSTCIKDYLSISYTICFITFLLFFVLII